MHELKISDKVSTIFTMDDVIFAMEGVIDKSQMEKVFPMARCNSCGKEKGKGLFGDKLENW